MDCEKIVQSFLKNCHFHESHTTGYLNLSDLDVFLDNLRACGFSFYKRNSTSYESSKRYKSSKIRFSFGSKIPFFGSPFIINKTVYMRCSQDGEYKPLLGENNEDVSSQKKRTSLHPTKKIGCKAFLRITYLLVFRSLIVENRQGDKKDAADKIKKDLPELMKNCETRLLIELSTSKEHNHPPSIENQIIHPLLKSEIYRLVANNIQSTTSVKPYLCEIVEKMIEDNKIPQPDINNHCFYPSNEVIRYHINMAKSLMKKENFDESAVLQLINSWKNNCDDEFYFKPSSTLSGNQIKTTPLFCHQTKWQQYLLNLYGNMITIMDAVHKTTDYTFPLYFLIVRTNQSYITVGTFVLHSSQEAAITAALNVFRQWSPNWDPKYFVCGCDENERNAALTAFPNCSLNLCSYRIHHSWKCWLKENNIDGSEHLFELWKALMYSTTEEEFVQNETLMRNHLLSKTNASAENYFYKIWYPLREKWVVAYQTQEFYVFMNLNNGSETSKEYFSYEFLTKYEDKMLSNILTIIIENYLPKCFVDYHSYNIPPNTILPDFTNKPTNFVRHVTERMKDAEEEFRGAAIVRTATNKFMLKSTSQKEWYHVDLEEVNCTCDDFLKWRYPCIHMCSIFIYTELNFHNLARWYLDSAFLNLDNELVQFTEKLPLWYVINERKRSQSIQSTDENVAKKKLVLDDVMQFSDPEIFVQETEVIARCDFSEMATLQNKRNYIQNLLEGLSNKVEFMTENELETCYQRLKNLQDELTISAFISF